MALSKEDCADILDHTRRRVWDLGLAELDSRVMLDFRATDSPSADFMRYLAVLSYAVAERSQTGNEKALNALPEGVELEGGGQVEGIEVMFTEGDAVAFGADLRADVQCNRNVEMTKNIVLGVSSDLLTGPEEVSGCSQSFRSAPWMASPAAWREFPPCREHPSGERYDYPLW